MARQIPYVGYLILGAPGNDPHLVAQECRSCGALFLDRRNACARCGGVEFGSRRLASEGVLRAFTIVHRATPDVRVPYVSGIVDLDGGGVVKANVVGVDPAPDQVTLGMKVALTTFVVGTDTEGTEAVSFGYRPILWENLRERAEGEPSASAPQGRGAANLRSRGFRDEGRRRPKGAPEASGKI